jgi:hypothetical protein
MAAMSRSRLAVALALVVSSVTAAACGGSSGGTTATAKTVPANQWIGELCTGISTWQANLQEVPDASTNTDLAKLKTEMASFLDGLVRNTEQLVSRVEKAGVPDVPQGDAAARAFKSAFSGMEGSFRQAKTTIDQTPTDEAQKFAAGLAQVGLVLQGSIQQAGKAFSDISTRYPDLGKAAKEVPACQKTAG